MEWSILEKTSESYNPLTLEKIIGRKILAKTKDQYWYAPSYDQEYVIYGSNQHNLTNEQYYEKFNTKVDVGESIGVIRPHHVLMEDRTQETFLYSLITLVHTKNCK